VLAGLGSTVWTEDKDWEAEEEGMPQLQGWPGLVLNCWWGREAAVGEALLLGAAAAPHR